MREGGREEGREEKMWDDIHVFEPEYIYTCVQYTCTCTVCAK